MFVPSSLPSSRGRVATKEPRLQGMLLLQFSPVLLHGGLACTQQERRVLGALSASASCCPSWRGRAQLLTPQFETAGCVQLRKGKANNKGLLHVHAVLLQFFRADIHGLGHFLRLLQMLLRTMHVVLKPHRPCAGETGFTTSGVGKMRYGNSPNKPLTERCSRACFLCHFAFIVSNNVINRGTWLCLREAAKADFCLSEAVHWQSFDRGHQR